MHLRLGFKVLLGYSNDDDGDVAVAEDGDGVIVVAVVHVDDH